MVTLRDLIEGARAVADDPGENIDATGRALRIGGSGDARRQGEAFQQFADIDAAGFQHGALGQVDLVQGDALEPRGDGAAGARKKTGADAEGALAEPQVEARRLHLPLGEGHVMANDPRERERIDLVGGENAAARGGFGRHGGVLLGRQAPCHP